MKLSDLYNRVVETIGMDVMTVASLQAAVKNCIADLTSRGYRDFKEIHLSETEPKYLDESMLVLKVPKDIRKVLYCRTFFHDNQANVAKRYSLSNPRVQAVYHNERFRTVLQNSDSIFYIKGEYIYIEWDPRLGPLSEIAFGYYARLIAPTLEVEDNTLEALKNAEIDIREEFEDALVFYAAYFYYSRYGKDVEKLSFYLNNYKYYVEDITHELAYEDEYFEEDAVIHEDPM